MITLNGSQSVVPVPVGWPAAMPGSGAAQQERPAPGGLDVDVYSGDSESWRNRAGAAGQTACRCGSCPACAAQAYAGQARAGSAAPMAATSATATATPSEAGQAGEMGQDEAEDGVGGPPRLDGRELSASEQARLSELEKIDRVVRAHEQAHMAAAGGLVRRGVSLSYEKGPDGRRYAVAGEVSIDTSPESDPAATIAKMRSVRAAALAPADPSPQDRNVAAAATVKMTDAMAELRLAAYAEADSGQAVGRSAAQRAAGSGEDGAARSADPGGPVPEPSAGAAAPGSWFVQRYAANAQGALGKAGRLA